MLNFCDFIQVIVLNHHSKQTNFAVKSIFEFSGGGGGGGVLNKPQCMHIMTTMFLVETEVVKAGHPKQFVTG